MPPAGADRTVYKRHDGKWVNKRNDRTRATSLHDTQDEATASAEAYLKRQRGGRLTVMNADGQILSNEVLFPEQ